MTTTFIPTLGSVMIVATPRQILAEVWNYYTRSVKSVSTIFFDRMISLSETVSQQSDARERLAEAIALDLRSVLSKYFDQVSVDVTTEDIDPDVNDGRYAVVVGIVVGRDGELFSFNNRARVRDGLLIQDN